MFIKYPVLLALFTFIIIPLAQAVDRSFSLVNDTVADIRLIYGTKSHPGTKEVEVKARNNRAPFKESFKSEDPPFIQIKTDTGDIVYYEFKVAPSTNVRVKFTRNWRTKEPQLIAELGGDNITSADIMVVEAPPPPAAPEAPPVVASSSSPSAPQTTGAAPAANVPTGAPATPFITSTPVKLSKTPEEILGVDKDDSDVSRVAKILGVEFEADIQNAAADEEQAKKPVMKQKILSAQETVTTAYEAQIKTWGAAKLPVAAKRLLTRHEINDAAEQKEAAKQIKALVESTYQDLKTRFAKP